MKIAKTKIAGHSVLWNWADGTQDIIKIDDLPKVMQVYAALHGIKQKGQDSYAEKGITLAEAKGRFKATIDSIMAGDWNRKGQTGSSMLMLAIARVTGKTVEEVVRLWDKKSEKEKKATESHPDVKLALANIKLERAKEAAKKKPDEEVKPLEF